MNFLSVNADAKTIKGTKRGYLTGVLYLAPHKLSGRNLCPNASPGCIDTCLNTAGRGVFNSVQKARIAKTHKFTSDPKAFAVNLSDDILSLEDKATRLNMTPLVRLNGTSDIPWENISYPSFNTGHEFKNLMAQHNTIQFYDYTKSYRRMWQFLAGGSGGHGIPWPRNYHLTFSRSECNDADALAVLSAGGNVAVVFSTKKGIKLPKTWNNFKVIDGDRDDIRHRDNVHSANGASSIRHRGVVIGLRAKGKARRDMTGFVVQV